MKPYYSEAGIEIYHGDCRQILPQIGTFDLLLTDPPYGIGASSGVGEYGVMKWGGDKDKKWDSAPPSQEVMDLAISSADFHVIWGMNYFTLPPTRKYLVWDKGAGFRNRTFAECELAWCSVDGNAKVFARDPLACGDYKGKEHPTEKPLPLFLWCINQIPHPVNSLIDPFMGSGTTLVAAKELGLRAVGVDIEERYCEIAANRLRQEVLQFA